MYDSFVGGVEPHKIPSPPPPPMAWLPLLPGPGFWFLFCWPPWSLPPRMLASITCCCCPWRLLFTFTSIFCSHLPMEYPPTTLNLSLQIRQKDSQGLLKLLSAVVFHGVADSLQQHHLIRPIKVRRLIRVLGIYSVLASDFVLLHEKSGVPPGISRRGWPGKRVSWLTELLVCFLGSSWRRPRRSGVSCGGEP
jgi:hypothetical protein